MSEEINKNNSETTLPELIENTLRFLTYLRRKWLIIILLSTLGFVLGIVYSVVKKTKYEADLTFSTFEEKSTGGGLAGIAAQFGVSIGSAGDVFNGDNLLALIQSKKILISCLLQSDSINGKNTNLLNYYLEISNLDKKNNLKNISFPLQQQHATFSRAQDSLLNVVCDRLLKGGIMTSRVDKKLDIFQITCISENEIFSKKLSQQLIKQVSVFYIETKTKHSAQTVDALQRRADSIKSAYYHALSGRASLADANINIDFQQPVVDIQNKQTDITVLATAYTEIIKNLELAKFNLLQNTPLIQIIDEPSTPLKKMKPGKLLSGIAGAFILFCMIIPFYGLKFIASGNRMQHEKYV